MSPPSIGHNQRPKMGTPRAVRGGVCYQGFTASLGALFFIAACAEAKGYERPQPNPVNGVPGWIVQKEALTKHEWDLVRFRTDVILCLTWFFATSGATLTLPSDFVTSANTVYCIGAGSSANSANGGGGGACSYSANYSGHTAGQSVNIQVGSGDTWFDTSTTIKAKVGGLPTGGAAASGNGGTRVNGGNGVAGSRGGGGGAGGISAGNNGSGQNGGQGDGSIGGAGGVGGGCATPGSDGTEFQVSPARGAGGGGAGGPLCGTSFGGNGGLYGGGAGGYLACACPGGGGIGAQGLIAISYTPVSSVTIASWFRSSDSLNPRLAPIRQLEEVRTFFLPSQVPVPLRPPLPTGADRERLPPIKQNPDPAKPWFVRSPNPVPAVFWSPPVSDRERLPPIKENPDPAKQWFVRSPNPVPNTWLPTTGKDVERLPPIKRPPDEPRTWFLQSQAPVPTFLWFGGWDQPRPSQALDRYVVTWPPSQPPATSVGISGMAWSISKEEMRPPLPPDRYVVTWPAAPPPTPASTISGIAWWRPADDARIVYGRGTRSPDEGTPFFRPSPNPVPTTWLPTTGETEHPVPVQRQKDEPPGPFFRPSQVPVPTFVVPKTGQDVERLPPIRENPDPSKQWFVGSPNPVPSTWLPTTGETSRPSSLERDRYSAPWFMVPVTTVQISGIAWLVTQEQMRPPPGPDQYVVNWTPKPPPPPVGISGIAWMIPSEPITRRTGIVVLALDGFSWLPLAPPSPIPPDIVILPGGGDEPKQAKELRRKKSGRVYSWGDFSAVEMTILLAALEDD